MGSSCSFTGSSGTDSQAASGGRSLQYQRGSLKSLGSSGSSIASAASHLSDGTQIASAATGSPQNKKGSLEAFMAAGSSNSWSGVLKVSQSALLAVGDGKGPIGLVRRTAARRLSAPPCAAERIGALDVPMEENGGDFDAATTKSE
jgi:hypothetical protein